MKEMIIVFSAYFSFNIKSTKSGIADLWLRFGFEWYPVLGVESKQWIA